MKPFPKGKFKTLIADPPWPFKNQGTRAATSNHYDGLTHNQLLALDPPSANEAHLYLWTTGGHLVDGSAAEVALAWGFVPKYLLAWVKTNDVFTRVEKGRVFHLLSPASGPHLKLPIGLGNWFRRNAEWVLFAVKGKLAAKVHNLPDTFFAPRLEHSRKPEVVHELAELMGPGPRLELFARRPRKGWAVWGAEV